MDIYTIRLKDFPNRYVGKENKLYALTTDATIADRIKENPSETAESIINPEAHWFTTSAYSKAFWTHKTPLKRFITYVANHQGDPNPTFSHYQFLLNGNVFDPATLFEK